MKCQLTLFTVLVILSNTALADWWQGWNNGNANTQGDISGKAQTNGATNVTGESQSNAQGWASGKGDADGNIDFSLNFKGSGKTNMDSSSNLAGNSQTSGSTVGNWLGKGIHTANPYWSGSTNNNSYSANQPWNISNSRNSQTFGNRPQNNWPPLMNPRYAPPQAPNFQQMQAQMEIQRKQYEATIKQMKAQQRAAAEAYQRQFKLAK